MIKLVPKKCSKMKYLRGVMEKKKPVVVVEEKKEVKKKPKATLMPCMIQSKKEREKVREKQLKLTEHQKKVYT